MRVTIASRIFAPEPAAAALRLHALALALTARGHGVTVVTSRAPGQETLVDDELLRVRRARVLRDRSGAVRGYIPYLSFDLPLFFRLILMRAPDVYVVEPPPTTGMVVRAVAAIKRRPYVYFAADVLADAAQGAGSPPFVIRLLRLIERACWNSARSVMAVSTQVRERIAVLGADPTRVRVVGNGIDTETFSVSGSAITRERPYVLYAGTASELHGAEVFVRAMVHVDDAELVFLSSGTELSRLSHIARTEAPGRVHFVPRVTPRDAASWFRGAALAVASVKPGGNYEYAFPTKLYAASACGAPILFSGSGPGSRYAASAPLGHGAGGDPREVGLAIQRALTMRATDAERQSQAEWTRQHFSMSAVAGRAADAIELAATTERRTS